MTSDEKPSRYPYLISVRGGRPVPARRDGHYYVCASQTFLGLWWPPREVTVLTYNPHRDFYHEQRQAQLDAQPQESTGPARPAGEPSQPPGEATDRPEEAAAVWERVETRPVPRPTPVRDTAPQAGHRPGLVW